MRRALLSAALAGAAVLGLGLGPADGRTRDAHASARARAAASSSHLRVTQLEYRLVLSAGTIRAGAVALAEIDGGREMHDLRLRRIGSSSTIDGRLLLPGRRWEGVVHLSPGTYQLWCSLAEHAELGMHVTLRVSG